MILIFDNSPAVTTRQPEKEEKTQRRQGDAMDFDGFHVSTSPESRFGTAEKNNCPIVALCSVIERSFAERRATIDLSVTPLSKTMIRVAQRKSAFLKSRLLKSL